MITLYHASQTRSIRPRWMLEEIGAPYQLVRLDLQAGDQRKPEFLKVNPNGTVPALVDGDLTLFESAAICQHLADRFPDKALAPAVGTPDRGRYYQWIHFAMSTIEPPLLTIFLHTVMLAEAERLPQLIGPARDQLRAALTVLETALTQPYLVGPRLTGADIMVGSTLAWAQMIGLLDASAPAVGAYLGRLMVRPAFQRAVAD